MTTFLAILGLACVAGFVYQLTQKETTRADPTLVPPPPKLKPLMAKPGVAFPFAMLTELAEQCAAEFATANLPFQTVPSVLISPAHYFKDVGYFYHYESKAIYFGETYANQASPEELAAALMKALSDAALEEHFSLKPPETNLETYTTASAVVSKIMKIEASKVSAQAS